MQKLLKPSLLFFLAFSGILASAQTRMPVNLGPVINNKTGETMTEVSITLDIDGKKVTMPSMVPTLTQKEINILANMPIENNFKNIPQSIIDKAVDHYFKRLDEGKSAFYQDGEDLQGDSEK